MAGDPFGLLLRQRIVFLGGEVSLVTRFITHLSFSLFTRVVRVLTDLWYHCRSMTLQQMQSSVSFFSWTLRTRTRYSTA